MLWVGAFLLCLFKFPFGELEELQNPYLWSACAVGMIVICLWKCSVTSWNVCWMCFLAWCAVGIIFGNPNPAFKSWQRLIYLCIGLMLLSPMIETRRLDLLRQRIWWCVCAFVVVSCLVAFVYKSVDLCLGAGVMRSLTAIVPMGLGLSHLSAIAAVIGVNAVMRFKLKSWVVCVVYGYIGVCIFLLFEGGSRMGLLSLMLAIVLLAMCYRNRRSAIFLSVLGGVTLLFCIYPEWWYDLAHVIYRKVNSGALHGSLTWSRDSLWAARWQEFLESPIYGVGLGAVRYFAAPWNNPEEILSHGHIEPGSSWLGLLSQTGAVGFALLVIPIVRIVVKGVKELKRNVGNIGIERREDFDSFKSILSSVDSIQLQMAVFLVLFIQSFTEGYILAVGSFHFLMFWVALSKMDRAEVRLEEGNLRFNNR